MKTKRLLRARKCYSYCAIAQQRIKNRRRCLDCKTARFVVEVTIVWNLRKTLALLADVYRHLIFTWNTVHSQLDLTFSFY